MRSPKTNTRCHLRQVIIVTVCVIGVATSGCHRSEYVLDAKDSGVEGDDPGDTSYGGGGDADSDADTDTIDTDTYPWAEMVDTYWGAAPDKETRLAVFDDLWQTIDDYHPNFGVLNIDWNAVREEYRPQVAEAEGPASRSLVTILYLYTARSLPIRPDWSPEILSWVTMAFHGGSSSTLSIHGTSRIADGRYPLNAPKKLRRWGLVLHNPHLFSTLGILRHGESIPVSVNMDDIIVYDSQSTPSNNRQGATAVPVTSSARRIDGY